MGKAVFDAELSIYLEGLRADQEPIMEGMPRHPKYKGAYFRALAEAFEAGKLLPVVWQEDAPPKPAP
mgnify:CR=1 FL=1